MNYKALIQNRKSVRAFQEKQVPFKTLELVKNYYRTAVSCVNCRNYGYLAARSLALIFLSRCVKLYLGALFQLLLFEVEFPLFRIFLA